MTWQPKIEPRERILAIGGPGVGKSSASLSIARKLPEVHFYIIDSDNSIPRLLATAFSDVAENGNYTLYRVDDWSEVMEEAGPHTYTCGWVEAMQDALSKGTRDDWLVVDMIGPAWDAVQDWYSTRVYGQDKDSYFMEARLSAKKGSPFDGRKDWTHINGVYKSNIAKVIHSKWKGHIWATAAAKAVGEDTDKGVKALFGAYGVMPVGQKHTGHIFETVLLLTKRRVGEFFYTSIKDRGREEVENSPITDAFKDYLVRVSGWRPAK